MFRTVFFYFGIILSLIVSLIPNLKLKWLLKKGKTEEAQEFTYRITYSWGKFVMKLAGANITIRGSENLDSIKNETVLFVSNHQSNFDIPLLLGSLDKSKGFIAKKELETWPIISLWMKNIQCVFMDRNNMRKSAEAIVQGINILKNGQSMVIFPEGTRSKGGPTHEFKAGSFKLATKSKVPVVPITINGTYKLLEANGGGKIKGNNVEIIIHKPINTRNLSKDELDNLHITVSKTITDSIK